jgi:hypothetical protein
MVYSANAVDLHGVFDVKEQVPRNVLLGAPVLSWLFFAVVSSRRR